MNMVAPTGILAEGARGFLQRFEAERANLPGDPAPREEAAALFRASGLPGRREEAWRYTDFRPVAEVSFGPAAAPDVSALAARLPAIDAPRLVFAAGRFRADLSTLPDKAAVRTGAPAFGALADPAREKLVALNTMFAADGAAVEVAAGVDAGTLVLASLGAGEEGRAVAFHPRHSIHLRAGAKLTLVEVAIGQGVYLHNPVTSVTVEDGATLVHLRLQDEAEGAFHLSTLYADVAARG
ncbi:MAG TPA: SufD family Fe-S cluster assembly protein, partial [Acetobacteraceae bacterium]